MNILKRQSFFLALLLLNICNVIETKDSALISDKEFAGLVHEAEKDLYYRQITTSEDIEEMRKINPKKPVTFVIFIAADNDLHYFAWKNIKQMEAIGSNENINIIVQLNTPGYFNPTKRYIIKQGRRVLVQADGLVPNQKLNSGSPYTLIDCVAWAMKHYPADHLYIDLWDHGTGACDPGMSRTINVCDLFYMNPSNNMLELDRSVGFLDLIAKESLLEEKRRGICFDETFKSYMTNQDLKFALSEIQEKVLGGKKIDVIGFDACLMSMIEIASICKDHVDYMVGSQEVEYGTGWDYETLLKPFQKKALLPKEFASHTVDAYEIMYHRITHDFTQSSLDLSLTNEVEKNLHLIAEQLIAAVDNQQGYSVSKLLQYCRSSPQCTCFDEPSYIDQRHFFINLQKNLSKISLKDSSTEKAIKLRLSDLLEKGINLINSMVIANKVGKNLNQASGISIYFPEHAISPSYLKSDFGLSNNWSLLLTKCLLNRP